MNCRLPKSSRLLEGVSRLVLLLRLSFHHGHGLVGSFSSTSETRQSTLTCFLATLLQSTAVSYRYGVSGGFWYASGATVQIILFATLAIELKRKAPNAHTFLEAVRARYGTSTHLV